MSIIHRGCPSRIYSCEKEKHTKYKDIYPVSTVWITLVCIYSTRVQVCIYRDCQSRCCTERHSKISLCLVAALPPTVSRSVCVSVLCLSLCLYLYRQNTKKELNKKYPKGTFKDLKKGRFEILPTYKAGGKKIIEPQNLPAKPPKGTPELVAWEKMKKRAEVVCPLPPPLQSRSVFCPPPSTLSHG